MGTGTIISARQLGLAVAAGAAYGVSPGLDLLLIGRTDGAGLAFLLGVAAPGEILLAQSLGYEWS